LIYFDKDKLDYIETMHIKKFIQTTIDLFDAQDIYHPDREQIIRNVLVKRYVGKCYMASYILEILEIVRYSETYLVNDRLDGSANIDVQFCAKCMVLLHGEVFCGSIVEHVRTMDIITVSDCAISRIIRNERQIIDRMIKKGQMLPLTVDSVSYSVGRDKMSVNAYPTVPSDFIPKVIYCYEVC
jgi:DNA-directed RNA polymerase subunit E'/Rpb7